MTQLLTFDDFYAKWGPGGTAASLNERQGAQPHFMDLCALLGVPTPGSSRQDGTSDYIFEQDTLLLGEARGYADVFKRGHFAWENKAPGKDLDKALKQLLGYSLALSNPPLLVVCDRATIRIHTQFTGHPSVVHTVQIAELAEPEKRALLKKLWDNPEWFRPKATTRDITEVAAKSFATLAARLRARGCVLDKNGNIVSAASVQPVNSPEVVAHFLTQCLFCFFADDVDLLPQRLFEGLVKNTRISPAKLSDGLVNLFTAMKQGGLYGNDDIPWFNGGLFNTINVPQLDILDVTELRNAAALNWTAIDVSIFGTLFERGLDPKKRSQLGAHYTDPATIARIIDPVIRRPLLQKWELTKEQIRRLKANSSSKTDKNHKLAKAAFVQWLEDLASYRILDPACGSGNFLFLGLKVLKDIEHQSHLEAAQLGLDREADLVTGPHNMLGLELNEYAAELARVTVWIGELQWRLTHGYEFKTNPVLEPLDCIECRDALLTWSADGTATEAVWPKTSVVVGNPPFLGGSKKRRELGNANFEALDKVYAGRVPGGADLVCYWFDKALKAIENKGLGAAGFVATNSIRGGSNRKVLDAICEKSAIFEAWSDEGWVNEGAAVRVSLIAFGHAGGARLDGNEIREIYSDLTGSNSDTKAADLSMAKRMVSNSGAVFEGLRKDGPLDVSGQQAREWLRQPNPHGKSNALVLFPLINGMDVTRRPRDGWVVDSGESMSEADASLFEAPFNHIVRHVKPVRLLNNDRIRRTFWWRFGRNGEQLRAALKPLKRYINTPRVSKYRLFVWQEMPSIPDTATVAISRADDATFGILHSRFHEIWSLRMGTWLGVGNDPRYTPTTCFETFPFPAGLTPQDTAHQQTRRLGSGAV
ncbi:MAG: DNA methyltransferase, partial [Burkholderiaceae bacterium]